MTSEDYRHFEEPPAPPPRPRKATASEWADPRCMARHMESIRAKQEDADAAYGKVPLDEFTDMRAEIARMREAPIDNTFREDYEIGVWAAELFISYRGYCKTCDLSVKFDHTEAVPS